MAVLKRRTKRPIVYAFIDSQNLNLGVQKVGWKMNWRAFRAYLHDNYNVTKAFMFIGYMAENEALYEHMHELGYLIALKPTVPSEKDDNEHKSTVKGNIDADLVLYAMKESPNYDKAIIVSGDGDFVSLIEYLANRNKLLNIMAPNWQYSSLLKPWESYIIRIDQLRQQLEYRDRPHRRRNTSSRD
jgi:uncharacterized LabA/DUF88 family protein